MFYTLCRAPTAEEERITIIRRVHDMLILFVVATDRNETTRIISARKAKPDEEAEYYENYDAR
ncbi:MAG: BrnT family toxin [Treponema sp.]|nr:BrnT family toxin [Treponema sp.]